MARKIVFETEVNQDGFSKGLAMMESRANQAMGRQAERQRRLNTLTAGVGGGFMHGGIAPASGGTGGIAGKSFAQRLGVAGSMFTSVARDSAASLASGAPITQVIAQQAPQVLQALAMMKVGMVAWLTIAGGAAVFAWHKLTKAISETVYENAKFIGQAKYYEKRADDIRKIRTEIEDMTQAENNAAVSAIERSKKQEDAAQKMLEANRDFEREQLNNRLATAGTSSEESTRQRAEQEIKFLKEDLAALQAKGPEKSAEALRIENEIAAKSRTPENDTANAAAIRQVQRTSLKEDLKAVMQIAGSEFARSVLEVENKISAKRNEIEATYTKDKFKATKSYVPGSDSLVSVGNFIGSARSKVEGTAQRQLEVLKMIEQNTRKTGGSMAGYPPL